LRNDQHSNFILEWFPGWQQHENYNRQPNDDGLGNEDCVELRRHFQRPAAVTSGLASVASSLTDSFMWNDRDCSTENFFLCERPLIDGNARLHFSLFFVAQAYSSDVKHQTSFVNVTEI